jgi:hypothetical protein
MPTELIKIQPSILNYIKHFATGLIVYNHPIQFHLITMLDYVYNMGMDQYLLIPFLVG